MGPPPLPFPARDVNDAEDDDEEEEEEVGDTEDE